MESAGSPISLSPFLMETTTGVLRRDSLENQEWTQMDEGGMDIHVNEEWMQMRTRNGHITH